MHAVFKGAERLSPDIWRFDFVPEKHPDHLAGQFIELTLPSVTAASTADSGRRWFTISSGPEEHQISITVRIGTRPSVFKWSLQALQPGDEVMVSDPLGDFVLPLDSSRKLAWIAVGIGVTPFHSMAHWLAGQSERRDIRLVQLFTKAADATIYRQIFDNAAIQTTAIHRFADSRADSTLESIQDAIPDLLDRLIFISGPESLVQDLQHSIVKTGLNPSDIVTDQFLGYR